MLPRFPRKVVGIQWNAVSADSGTGIKRHEPKWLSCGCANDFPRVDVQRITEPGHFIRHADVNCAKSVLQKFCGFSDTRRTHCMYVLHDLRIQISGYRG